MPVANASIGVEQSPRHSPTAAPSLPVLPAVASMMHYTSSPVTSVLVRHRLL